MKEEGCIFRCLLIRVGVTGVLLSKKDIVREDREVTGRGCLIMNCDTDQLCDSDVQ